MADSTSITGSRGLPLRRYSSNSITPVSSSPTCVKSVHGVMPPTRTSPMREADADLGVEHAAERVERELALEGRLVPEFRGAADESEDRLHVGGAHHRSRRRDRCI